MSSFYKDYTQKLGAPEYIKITIPMEAYGINSINTIMSFIRIHLGELSFRILNNMDASGNHLDTPSLIKLKFTKLKLNPSILSIELSENATVMQSMSVKNIQNAIDSEYPPLKCL